MLVGRLEVRGALGDHPFEIALDRQLARGVLDLPELPGEQRDQCEQDQHYHDARLGLGRGDGLFGRRKREKPSPFEPDRLGGQAVFLDAHEDLILASVERQSLKADAFELAAPGDLGQFLRAERAQGAEPQLWAARHDHDVMHVGNQADAGLPCPGTLQCIELDLDHDHAEWIVNGSDPPGQVEPGPSTYCAKREELGGPAT